MLVKATKEEEEEEEKMIHWPNSEPTELEKRDNSGTLTGAVSLIIGTTIGSGILALPQKTYTAVTYWTWQYGIHLPYSIIHHLTILYWQGFIPSATSMVVCWAFLLVEALLLAEVNVFLRHNRKNDSDSEDVISFKTMAQETLGDWGANVATWTYVFLAYTSMVAYASKSGDLLSPFFSFIPSPMLAALFTTLVASIIFLGENNAAYQINQWLTASMIGR